MASLYETYRPKGFEDVIGQPAVVRSLKAVLGKKSNHAFLLTGPSGTGKTTLARICATVLGATDPKQVREFDAATKTGIDDVREITSALAYRPLGVDAIKVMIVDECHALSAPAWKALLKPIEEPPPWLYWFFCTTEATRVPVTIKTRCNSYALQPVAKDVLVDWLTAIAAKETKLLDHEDGERIILICAKEALGSPRQALVNLATVSHCKKKSEAIELLRSAEGSTEAIELARMLDKGATWQQVQALLEALKDTNPESIRQIVRAYTTKSALGAETEKAWAHRLKILDAFDTPCNSQDGIAPIMLATARAMFT